MFLICNIYREVDIRMSTLSHSNSNDYEEITKYCDMYAEVGEKAYATISAKVASVDENYDFSLYVPMAPAASTMALDQVVKNEGEEENYATLKL